MIAFLKAYIPQFDRDTFWVILLSTLCLLSMHYLGAPRFFNSELGGSLDFLFGPNTWFGTPKSKGIYGSYDLTLPAMVNFGVNCCFWGAIMPLIFIRWIHRLSPREIGWAFPKRREGLLTLVIILGLVPIMIGAANLIPQIKDNYPLAKDAKYYTWEHFIMYQGLFLLYWTGWEGMLRGYILFTLEKKWGDLAILWQLLPFIFMKINKPWPETFSAIIAGLALGLIALRGRSILPCILLHFTAAFTVDLVCYLRLINPVT